MIALQIAQERIKRVQLGYFLGLDSGTNLNLRGCGLTTEDLQQLIRKNIDFFSKLTCLNLKTNKLNTLPKEIGKLTKLRILYLDNNNLSTLPKEIEKLIELRILSLNDNHFSTLPKEIENLIELIYLHLHNNNFHTLPKLIKKLTNLQNLVLSNNPLDNNTLSFLRNMEDMGIQTNISAYENRSHWKDIFTDMPEYKDNATFIKGIESDTKLQRFISKARSSALYNINKHEMTTGLDFLFKALLDPESKDHYINSMKIHATDCSTPVATYVTGCYLASCVQQNKKPNTGFVDKSDIYSFISKSAEKLKLQNNARQAHEFLNAVCLGNSKTYSDNICKISRGDITNYKLPFNSPTNVERILGTEFSGQSSRQSFS